MQQIVRAALPPSSTTTVLDIGCGTGANIASLAGDYRCVGIDTSAEAIELSAARYPNVDFRHGFAPGDVADVLPQADLVMMMDVLEHVPDDFELLSNVMARAKVGAKFLLTVPAELALWSPHDESFGHYRRYDEHRFAAIWADLPVDVELCSYYNARLYPLVKFIRQRNRRRGAAAGKVGTDFDIPHRWANHLLTETFAGEATRLEQSMRNPDTRPYAAGVSLIAMLTRTEGQIAAQKRPAHLTPDYFDPVAGQVAYPAAMA